MNELSFPLMTFSWKADTLFGVSAGPCFVGVDTDTMGAAVGVVIVGRAAGDGGGRGFERCVAADGSRTRGRSAMSSKREAAASRLNTYISWFHRQ
jgi:hypothetical protein